MNLNPTVKGIGSVSCAHIFMVAQTCVCDWQTTTNNNYIKEGSESVKVFVLFCFVLFFNFHKRKVLENVTKS